MEYSKKYGIKLRTVYSQLNKRKIPGATKEFGQWRIPSKDIQGLHIDKNNLTESITYLDNQLSDKGKQLEEILISIELATSSLNSQKSQLEKTIAEVNSATNKLTTLNNDLSEKEMQLIGARKQYENFTQLFRDNATELLHQQKEKLISIILNDGVLLSFFSKRLNPDVPISSGSKEVHLKLSFILSQISDLDITVIGNFRVIELLETVDNEYKNYLANPNDYSIYEHISSNHQISEKETSFLIRLFSVLRSNKVTSTKLYLGNFDD